MSEADYTRLTYDFTTGWARVLARINAEMTLTPAALHLRQL
ncbi:MAG TPA: hypothetical protein VF973_15530 [Myxococcales bacterium]